MQNCYRRIKYPRPIRKRCKRASRTVWWRQAFRSAATPPTRPQMWGLFQCATRVYKCNKRHWDRRAQHHRDTTRHVCGSLRHEQEAGRLSAQDQGAFDVTSPCRSYILQPLTKRYMSASIVVQRASNWRGDALITITTQHTLSKTLCVSSMRTRRPCCKDTHEDRGGRNLFNRPILKLLVPHKSKTLAWPPVLSNV